MPIVPSSSVVKSVVVGTPYSPVTSFNPDKKLFFDTDSTTLGMLAGTLTTNGTNVTIPIGTKFIQNGIVVNFTVAYSTAIPGGAFPKYVTVNNDNEVSGSSVTVTITSTAPTAPVVLMATLTPNDSTIVQTRQISIRGIDARLQVVETSGSGTIATENDDVAVKAAHTINAVGPNVAFAVAAGDQADLSVVLDLKEGGAARTSKTNLINVTGAATVTADTANHATINVTPLIGQDEGVTKVAKTTTIDFIGAGVTSAVDGGNPNKLNVTIPGESGSNARGSSGTLYGTLQGAIDGETETVVSDTTQAGTVAGTIVGSGSLSGSDDTYNDYFAILTDTTPADRMVCRYSRVAKYVGSTKTITLDAPLDFGVGESYQLVKPARVWLLGDVDETVTTTKNLILNVNGKRITGGVDQTTGALLWIRGGGGFITNGVQKTNLGALRIDNTTVSRRGTTVYAVLLTNGSDLGRCDLFSNRFAGRVAARRGRMGWKISGCVNQGVKSGTDVIPYALVESITAVSVTVTQLDVDASGEFSGAVLYSENSITGATAFIETRMNVDGPSAPTGAAAVNIGANDIHFALAVAGATLDVTKTSGDQIIQIGKCDGTVAILGARDVTATASLVLNGSSQFGMQLNACNCKSIAAVNLRGATQTGTIVLGGTDGKKISISGGSFTVVASEPNVTAGTLTVSGSAWNIQGAGWDDLAGFAYFRFMTGTITAGAVTWTISATFVVGHCKTPPTSAVIGTSPTNGTINVSGAIVYHNCRMRTLFTFVGAAPGPTYTISGPIEAHWSGPGSTAAEAVNLFEAPVAGSATISNTTRLVGGTYTSLALVLNTSASTISHTGAITVVDATVLSSVTALLRSSNAAAITGSTGVWKFYGCQFEGALTLVAADIGGASITGGPSAVEFNHCTFLSTLTQGVFTGTVTWTGSALRFRNSHVDGLLSLNDAGRFSEVQAWESTFNGNASNKAVSAAGSRPTTYRLWKCTARARHEDLKPEMIDNYVVRPVATALNRGQPLTVDTAGKAVNCSASSILEGVLLLATAGTDEPALMVTHGTIFVAVDSGVVNGDNLVLDTVTPTVAKAGGTFVGGQEAGRALEAAGATTAGLAYSKVNIR